MDAKWNTRLKWFVITLSVATLILICTLVVMSPPKQDDPDYGVCILGGGKQRSPDEGTWVCEDLGLSVSFDKAESIWSNNGTIIPCMLMGNRISPYLSVYEIDEKIPLDNVVDVSYGYLPGARLFHFTISSFTNDSMVVNDDAGNVYTFYREQGDGSIVTFPVDSVTRGQGDGSVVPSPSPQKR